jgi:hypothetical protein
VASGKKKERAGIDSVWSHWLGWWKRVVGKGTAPQLTKKRAAHIRARLRDGYTVERLKRAADGCWTREYNLEHGYLKAELVYRDGGQVEQYEGFADALGGGGATQERELARIRADEERWRKDRQRALPTEKVEAAVGDVLGAIGARPKAS